MREREHEVYWSSVQSPRSPLTQVFGARARFVDEIHLQIRRSRLCIHCWLPLRIKKMCANTNVRQYTQTHTHRHTWCLHVNWMKYRNEKMETATTTHKSTKQTLLTRSEEVNIFYKIGVNELEMYSANSNAAVRSIPIAAYCVAQSVAATKSNKNLWTFIIIDLCTHTHKHKESVERSGVCVSRRRDSGLIQRSPILFSHSIRIINWKD